MKYSEMTDFEINKAVAAACLAEWYDNGTCVIKCDDDDRSIFQPCNSWADAGPIIQSNGITVAFSDESWFADASAYWVDGVEWQIDGVIHENPLRAAMVVFLMMQEPK